MAKKRVAKNETEGTVDEVKRHVHPTTLSNIKLTDKQKELIKLFDKNTITILTGFAGTSKTFISCYYAIKLLKDNKIEKIILTKPIEESGEKLGFLPGTVEEKISPYMESFKGNLLKLITRAEYDKLISKEIIEYKPLAYMRGVNLDKCLIIGDEFQNADLRQIILFVTRMGQESKIILSGDINQTDIGLDKIALKFFANMTKNIKGVSEFEFKEEDIMRHPILIEITKLYEEAKLKDTLPKNKR